MIEYYKVDLKHITIKIPQHAGLWGHFPLVLLPLAYVHAFEGSMTLAN